MNDRWLQLQQCAVFSDLSQTEFKALKQHVRVREFEQNEAIVQAVSPRQALFIVLEGTVDLIIAYKENEQKSAVLTLKTGDFWGEHTLLEQGDIVLAAVAKSQCLISELPKKIITPLAKQGSSLLKHLKKECKRHCFYPILSFMPLFEPLTPEERQGIAEHLFNINIAKGTEIIHEGEFDESIYLIKSGEVEVYTSFVEREELQVVQVAQERARLAILQTGDFFGEGAFFTKEPRSATIMASTDVQLLKLPGEDLKTVLKDYPRIEEILKQYHQQRVASTMTTLQSIF
jgi:CRP-like cAMP-binding protein